MLVLAEGVHPPSGLCVLHGGGREEERDINGRELGKSKTEERVSMTNDEIFYTSFNLCTENDFT